jgi:hypothetical protein
MSLTKIKIGTEGQFTFNTEVYNFRVYKDGGVKLETLNSLDFFDSVEDFKSALVGKTITKLTIA